MTRFLLPLFVMIVGIGLVGCGQSLTLTRVNSAEDDPNNVWVFFTVEHGEEPVGGLKASDFKIYEDGGLVSEYESKQVILNPEVAAVMYTLLLLDVSGSITESGQTDDLVDAAELFTERVGKTQKVAVYAFDGEEKIHPVVPFTETEGALKGGLDGLRKYEPKDPSTNLHGAVVQGLAELRAGLDKEDKPLKFGTLVVFSDGADRASRVSRDEMVDEIRKEEYETFDMFAIGIGDDKELEEANLKDVGRDGTEEGSDRAKVKEAFESIAKKIEAHSKRYYLLSYCPPRGRVSTKWRFGWSSKSPRRRASSPTLSAPMILDRRRTAIRNALPPSSWMTSSPRRKNPGRGMPRAASSTRALTPRSSSDVAVSAQRSARMRSMRRRGSAAPQSSWSPTVNAPTYSAPRRSLRSRPTGISRVPETAAGVS